MENEKVITSSLLKLEALNYNTNYTYAPPTEIILIAIEDISSVIPVSTRRCEPCSQITMKNGKRHHVIGSPSEIYDKCENQRS